MPDLQLITAHDGPSKAPIKKWSIKASPAVARSVNPIRTTLASLTAQPPTTPKPIINLGLGDPTHYPLHPPPPAAIDGVKLALEQQRANGYLPGPGAVSAKQAVRDYHRKWDGVEYPLDSIVLTHGVSQALDMIFSVLLPPTTPTCRPNILLPRPGFGSYSTLLANLDTEVRFYALSPENGWEADLDELDSLCDDETRAIVVTNPSNPCGSNYSSSHLLQILSIAERHKIPIIADEIYGHMTWDAPFTPMASLTPSPPIITLLGLSKRFLLPGWRFGWICLHDPLGLAHELRDGFNVWSSRFMGPNSLVQAALPSILETGQEWHDEVLAKIKMNAEIMYDAITRCPGLWTTVPQGALYMLVKVDRSCFPAELQDDVDFARQLYREQAVFLLPGMCFEAQGWVRIVLGAPAEVMRDVGERMVEFCQTHAIMA